MVELAQLRTEPKVTGCPTRGIILLVGHPKCGKTWLGSSIPDSLVVALEESGADRVPWGRIQEINRKDALNEFNEVMQLALEDNSIKTIVIDTVDELAKLFQADICADAGVEHMQKPKPGVDSRALWGEFASRVTTLTDALNDSGKLIVMIAHCKPPEKDSDGRVMTPAGINVSGKGGNYIASKAEVIGFVGVRVVAGKAQHYVSFKATSDLAIWRSRVKEFHDREIVLAEDNPWGSVLAVFAQKKPVATAPTKLVEKPKVDKKIKGGKK